MNYRFADGSDKIVAFERGLSDEQAHFAFETAGVNAAVVNETYLVVYSLYPEAVYEHHRSRLYAGRGTPEDVEQFLQSEAETFGIKQVEHTAR